MNSPMEIHDICKCFPEMPADEFELLSADIAEHGQIEPIWTHENKIIDGRHRYRACVSLKIKPLYRGWNGEGGSILGFVIAQNLHRRHLTPGQRAAIAIEVKPQIEAEIREQLREKQREAAKETNRKRNESETSALFANNGKERSSEQEPEPRNARNEAAKRLNVSHGYVADAEKIREKSPEVFDAVKTGEKTIPEAKRELGLNRPKQPKPAVNGQSRVNGHLQADPPDVAKMRSEGKIAPETIVEIDEPGETTSVDDVREDINERAAIEDDSLSDQDWLAALPLSGKLTGPQLRVYHADALAYRTLEGPRRTFRHHATRACNIAKNKGSFVHKVKMFLAIDHPKKWLLCPTTENGGCGGSGQVPLMGECQRCFGRGYWLNH